MIDYDSICNPIGFWYILFSHKPITGSKHRRIRSPWSTEEMTSGRMETIGDAWRFHLEGWFLPKMPRVYSGKYQLEMDDDWGYPYLRKPPSMSRDVSHHPTRKGISSPTDN